MASFSLVIEYLTGYAVATDPSSRERAEWPPHPARIFMALAAAHFETAPGDNSQREALEWLASLSPPSMVVPEHTCRGVLGVYVPVNDQSGAEALVKRSRQPRTFPRVFVGTEPLRLIYDAAADDMARHLPALDAICRDVTRVGHSSSLVWLRVERDPSPPPTHVPDEHSVERGLRITQAGELDRLSLAYNAEAIEEYASFETRVTAAKGAAKKQLQAEVRMKFPGGRPITQRPTISLSHGYRAATPPAAAHHSSLFDPNFIVLRESDDGPASFGIESTALAVEALRGLLLKHSPIQPPPAWVSGHEASGEKLESGPHLAIVPLAFVGSQHADGHLMGLGILIPKTVPLRDRSKVLSPVLFNETTNEPRTLRLTMGRAGVWEVERETSFTPKRNLQPLTYTAAARSWASVTPVVLDRMPKTDRRVEPTAWREEVAEIIALSCVNVGLPEPSRVRVEKTPFFRGSLRAMPGRGGFPLLRDGRFQVHVAIEFDRNVGGPVLIGAGRFRGYGLLRPWDASEAR